MRASNAVRASDGAGVGFGFGFGELEEVRVFHELLRHRYLPPSSYFFY